MRTCSMLRLTQRVRLLLPDRVRRRSGARGASPRFRGRKRGCMSAGILKDKINTACDFCGDYGCRATINDSPGKALTLTRQGFVPYALDLSISSSEGQTS